MQQFWMTKPELLHTYRDNVIELQYRPFWGISVHWCKVSGVWIQSLSSHMFWCLGRMLPRYRQISTKCSYLMGKDYINRDYIVHFLVFRIFILLCLKCGHTGSKRYLWVIFGGDVYMKILLYWGQLSKKISLGSHCGVNLVTKYRWGHIVVSIKLQNIVGVTWWCYFCHKIYCNCLGGLPLGHIEHHCP